MNKWIDVKDEQPNKEGDYLVFSQKEFRENKLKEPTISVAHYFMEKRNNWWSHFNVLYWSYLPQEPMSYLKYMYATGRDGEWVFVHENGLEYIRENYPSAIFEISGYLKDEGDEDDGKEIIYLALNCNDLFYWACADMEIFGYKDIESIYLAIQESPNWGIDKWICKKRGMRPQHPVEDAMKKSGSWDDEMEALPVRGNTG